MLVNYISHEGLFIAKPDMVANKDAMHDFETNVENTCHIIIKEKLYIEDWISVAKKLYDADESYDLRVRKLAMLLTYVKLYRSDAIAYIFKTDDFSGLIKYKKDFRKQYVWNTSKTYINIHRLQELGNFRLINLDIDRIEADFRTCLCNEELNDPKYIMAFINKLHCPDEDDESMKRDIDIVRSGCSVRK